MRSSSPQNAATITLEACAPQRGQRPRLQPSSGPRHRCRTRPRRWLGARGRRGPYRSGRCSAGRAGCRGCWCSRSSRSGSSTSAWRYTNEIDVLFVLACAWVEVVGGRVGNVASGVIGYDGNVVAYLVLLRPAFQRSERLTDRYIRRPGSTTVRAIRVE